MFIIPLLFVRGIHAAPEQVHVSYTGKPSELALDFVSSSNEQAYVTVTSRGVNTRVNTSSFHFPQIGYMNQALLSFPGIERGESASYTITADGASSESFSVTPELSHPERFAIFGDFGLVNDVCMEDLTAQAKAGVYDSVLHVGDCAYTFSPLSTLSSFAPRSVFSQRPTMSVQNCWLTPSTHKK